MGSTCSVVNDTNGTMYCKFGPNLGALDIALAVIGEVAEFIPVVGPAIAIAAWAGEAAILIDHMADADQLNKMKGKIEDWFKDRGYGVRGQSSSYVSEKLSLSLVVSAHCATLIDLGGGKLELRVGDMTCWTGPTDGENYEYKVSSCDWQKITYPINRGGGAVAGLEDDVEDGPPDTTKANLAQDTELLAKIQECLSAKGGSTPMKPGVQPS